MKIKFTTRETELITLIADGKENREIAEELFISIRTVESHRKNILLKMNCKNFYKVISYSFKNQILSI